LRGSSRENEKCGSETTGSFTTSTTKTIKYSFSSYATAGKYTELKKFAGGGAFYFALRGNLSGCSIISVARSISRSGQ
jgi:hypothetical protein